MKRPVILIGLFGIILAFAVTGCGGGGGGSDNTSTQLNWDQGNWDKKNWQ